MENIHNASSPVENESRAIDDDNDDEKKNKKKKIYICLTCLSACV